MRVLILGVGDAFTKKSFGSSALIEAPNGYVLLDCPDLIHRALHEATTAAGWSVDASGVDDIILTHLHGDHCNGLESFGFSRMIQRMSNPEAALPRIHTSTPASERLWERLAPAMDRARDPDRPTDLGFFYDVRVLETEREANVAGLRVRCRFTGHPIPTIGLLISDDREQSGWTLGWSSDTPYEQDHIDWLAQADIIVHESNHGAAHTSIESLSALPDDLRRHMRLIHLPDDFDHSVTDIRALKVGEVLEGDGH